MLLLCRCRYFCYFRHPFCCSCYGNISVLDFRHCRSLALRRPQKLVTIHRSLKQASPSILPKNQRHKTRSLQTFMPTIQLVVITADVLYDSCTINTHSSCLIDIRASCIHPRSYLVYSLRHRLASPPSVTAFRHRLASAQPTSKIQAP